MERVFVSHCPLDRDQVEDRVLPALRGKGLTPWCLPDSSPDDPGNDAGRQRGMEECELFLIVLSWNYVRTPSLSLDVAWAYANRRNRLLLIRIDDCPGSELKRLLDVDPNRT